MRGLTTIAIFSLSLCSAVSSAGTAVTVYKSATCGCCENYVEYLKRNGFTVKAVNEDNMDLIKERYGTADASSCHTSIIEGYAVEGHVPVRAIHKLLREKPNLVGISAPGMPQNSPGMGPERPGTLTIYAIPKGGAQPTVFSVE